MRKNLAIRMADTPESPFTTRLKEVAEALGLFCHSDLPDDALDKRSREDAWNGKLGTKHKHVARSLYDGLWKAAGGAAVIGWNGAMPAKFKEHATYNRKALELLGTRDSFISLAEKQFKEGGRRTSCGTNGGKGQSRSVGDSPLLDDTTTKSLRADLDGKLSRAQELHARDDNKEAIALLEEVYHAARSHGLKEQQLEAALNLGFTTSDRHDFKTVERRLRDAEKLIRDVKTPWHQTQYYRLKAKVLRHKKHLTHAEKALKKAIEASERGATDVAVVRTMARADYVHLLCEDKRASEADSEVSSLRKIIEHEGDSEPTALVAACVEACIHWAISKGDTDQLRSFVDVAVRHGATPESAICIGHTLHRCATGAQAMNATGAVVLCAEAAERLGQTAHRPDLSLAAGYAAAQAFALKNDYTEARKRCVRLIEMFGGLSEPVLICAVSHLLSQTCLQLGDKNTAVEMAEATLKQSDGNKFSLCLGKLALAEALCASGKVSEAIQHARSCVELGAEAKLPPEWLEKSRLLVAECASMLGDWDDAESAMAELKGQSPGGVFRAKVAENRIEMFKGIRKCLDSVITTKDPLAAAGTEGAVSVHDANSWLMRGIIEAWEAYPRAACAVYDYWGRGNLARAMLNMRAFPEAFKMTIEVGSVDEARRAVRLWALVADVLVLVWKEPTVSSQVACPVPPTMKKAGGGGYLVMLVSGVPTNSDVLNGRDIRPQIAESIEGSTPFISNPNASLLPDEVGVFLVGEAKALVAAGRLIVVPYTGIGAAGMGHGFVNNLFAQACDAMPAIKGDASRLSPSWIPYFPDVPLEALGDVLGEHELPLSRLRRLIYRKAREYRASGVVGTEAKEFEMELRDSIAELADAQAALRRKHGWSEESEAVASLSDGFTESTVRPLLVLQSMGYRWHVEQVSSVQTAAPENMPRDDEPICTWLQPPDTVSRFVTGDEVSAAIKARKRGKR